MLCRISEVSLHINWNIQMLLKMGCAAKNPFLAIYIDVLNKIKCRHPKLSGRIQTESKQ